MTDDTSVLTLRNLAFEPLLRWQTGGQVAPGLIAAWEHTPDGRIWRFHLREGARFHDGAPCTAEDALAAIEAAREAVDSFGMRWSYARYLAEARFTVEARHTLRMENPEPLADILDILAEFFLVRCAPDGQPVIGTGPYRVEAFEPDARIGLAAVTPGRGPARIEAVAMPSAEARLAALRTGQVDAALNLERLCAHPDFAPDLRWTRAVNTLSVMCYLNAAQGLFVRPEARLAANLAVDVDAILAEVFGGLGVPAATVVSPHHLGFRAAGVAPIAHDPARARALFAGGGEVTLRTPEFMPDRAVEACRMIARDLERAGLTVRLDVQRDRPEYAREIGAKRMGDIAIFDSSPVSTFRVLDDKISAASRAVWWQGYEDAEAEALFQAARRAVEPAAREAAYGRVLARLNAAPPWLYLFHPVEVMAARPGVEGLSLDARGVLEMAGESRSRSAGIS